MEREYNSLLIAILHNKYSENSQTMPFCYDNKIK